MKAVHLRAAAAASSELVAIRRNVPALVEAPPGAVLLDRNENRYGPAPACMQTLREIEPSLLFNYTRAFNKGYYSDLSRRLGEVHQVDDTRIVLGYGCEDLLKQAAQHFVREGQRLMIPSASWWYYGAIAEDVQGVTVEYPLIETATAYVYDFEALIRLHKQTSPRLVLIASPNNPTGNAIAGATLRDLLESLRDTTVILDQAYHGFDGVESGDLASLADEYPNLLILRTFSKLYGLAGARIGYGIAGRGLDRFRGFCSRNLGYNRISEKLALAALDSPEYYARIQVRIEQDRERMTRFLRRFECVRVYESQACFLLVRFPVSIVPALRSALSKRGLFVKFFTQPQFCDCVRVSLGTTEENARLLAAFEELLPDLLAKAS
jgi:histidinol-phosphate aminotransferase